MDPIRFNTLLAISAATLAASTALAGVLVLRLRRAYRHALAALEALAIAEASTATTPADANLPVLCDQNPWRNLIQSVSHALATSRVRADQAEAQRTALEVRARRNAAQCESLTAILRGLGEPVLVVDDYDELVLANASAERLFNFDARDAGSRALARIVRCEKLLELVHETRVRKTTVRTEELELTGADGQRRWYSVSAQALTAGEDDDSGSLPRGAVAVLRDISAQKAIQRRNAEFVSAVSHEMKTPLTGIKAYVELLADGEAEDDATRDEFLSVIELQADRLQRLIDNLLDLSRIEAGVVQVQKRQLALNEILSEASNIVRPSAEAKSIELVTQLSPLHLSVLVDRDQMLQAAINLLSNAIKYTAEGGRVTLYSRLNGNEAEFSVEDTGVGLAPADQERVFERFYRVAKDKQMAPGTGLGLPLARSIVEEVHGGRLTLASELGVGSTFTVALPCAGQLN